MATLQQLLAPQVILEAVTSRIKQPGDVLQRFCGMGLGGGPAVLDNNAMRYAAFDIFDHIQAVGTFRAPNTGPATIARNSVAQVPITIPRVHMKVGLQYEELGNLRPLGKTSGNVDQGGKDYITRQEAYLKQYHQNAREFMVAGMLRGNFYFQLSGDDWNPSFTSSGALVNVNYQIPAGNKNQLNMTGGGNIITISWANTAAATIFEDILAVNSAYYQISGWPLKHIWMDSVMWGYVTNNAGIKSRSGTANVVFEEFKRVPGYDDPDKAMDEFTGRLRCLPDFVFHIYDGGSTLASGNSTLDSNATFTKWLPSTQAFFMPEPSPNLYQLLIGGEYVVEQDGMAGTLKRGLSFWPRYVAEPSRIELNGLDNAVPIVRVPKTLAPATPVF